MNNYNNYPENIVAFSKKFASVFIDSDEHKDVVDDIIHQAVYDVISPLIFKQFLENGDTETLGYDEEDEEEMIKQISYCTAQIHLRALESKGLTETFNDGESFTLSEIGRAVQEEIINQEEIKKS